MITIVVAVRMVRRRRFLIFAIPSQIALHIIAPFELDAPSPSTDTPLRNSSSVVLNLFITIMITVMLMSIMRKAISITIGCELILNPG